MSVAPRIAAANHFEVLQVLLLLMCDGGRSSRSDKIYQRSLINQKKRVLIKTSSEENNSIHKYKQKIALGICGEDLVQTQISTLNNTLSFRSI